LEAPSDRIWRKWEHEIIDDGEEEEEEEVDNETDEAEE
jgi:hypothetical protein